MNIEVENKCLNTDFELVGGLVSVGAKKEIRKPSNVAVCLYRGYICVHSTGKCTDWFVFNVIMNVEVETNVETQILSLFVY